jgi:hypothetical protein
MRGLDSREDMKGADPIAMMPAYGGMFRPRPRRTGLIVALIVAIVVVGACAFAAARLLQHP